MTRLQLQQTKSLLRTRNCAAGVASHGSPLQAAGAVSRHQPQSTQAAPAAAVAQSKHFLMQSSNKEQLSAIRAAWPKPDFNITALKNLLDHDNIEMRDQFREFLKQDLFKPRYRVDF